MALAILCWSCNSPAPVNYPSRAQAKDSIVVVRPEDSTRKDMPVAMPDTSEQAPMPIVKPRADIQPR